MSGTLKLFQALYVLCSILASVTKAQPSMLDYPPTRQVEQTDVFHGVEVADPHRWLEEDPRNSPEVAEWIEAQNQVTRTYLDALPSRAAIRERLTKLWDYERYSAPSQTAGKYFYLKNDGLQNQEVLYVADRYDAVGRVLLDPNTWSEDGTVALGSGKVSDDARYLAYLRKEAGSDWSTICVVEIDSGRQLEDQLLWTRWGNIVWNADSTGFYYIRYPQPAEGQQFQSSVTDPMCCFHRLGTSQSDDVLIYRRPDEPNWSFYLERTEDDQLLVLSIGRSTDPQNQVWIRPVAATADAAWTPLIEDFDNEFSFVGKVGDELYFVTDLDASTKRIVAMNLNTPGRGALREVVPASEATLVNVSLLDGQLLCSYLQDVVTEIKAYDLEGALIRNVGLPGIGSASGFGGRQKDRETFYSFTNYTTPSTIYRYDVESGASELIRAPKLDFNPADYTVRQAFYQSKDGTRVPIIVSHRKDLVLDGQRPTLLYAYGGFNISLTPGFSVSYAAWMDMGGVLAVPNLRGGGEYGEAWHLAGKKLKKQNVFDDFLAAAEWLINEEYTSSKRLAIMGGSNGGLLVGAAMTQRPELFGACLPSVGVMDMLRYHLFTAGHFWVDEYGSVDNADEFHALLAYSPYHNIKSGTVYPATMVMSADTDDRVVPMHSFKFGARLQAAQAGSAPILLRIETRAGHGAGTPTSKLIDAVTDRWAFLWKNLGMQPLGAK